jgi:predicted DNA-binding mobile mystery protein A
MKPSERAAQARDALDRKLQEANLGPIKARPHAGWIQAAREALGMSQTTLARRLGISRGSASQLEHAELHGGITISKLSEVAAALNCTLVYAIVPDDTFEQTVLDRARAVVAEDFRYAARTMELEAQGVSSEFLRDALERAAQELVRKGDVWGTA